MSPIRPPKFLSRSPDASLTRGLAGDQRRDGCALSRPGHVASRAAGWDSVQWSMSAISSRAGRVSAIGCIVVTHAAVENDHKDVDTLLQRLATTPTPAGPTPRDLSPPTGPSLPMHTRRPRAGRMRATDRAAAISPTRQHAATGDAATGVHERFSPARTQDWSAWPAASPTAPGPLQGRCAPFPSPAGSVPRPIGAGTTDHVNHPGSRKEEST